MIRLLLRSYKVATDPFRLLRRICLGRVKEILIAVALSEYPRVFLDLHEGRCPICGYKAKRKVGIWRHVRYSGCRVELTAVAYDILEKYRRARRILRKRTYNGRTRYAIDGKGMWSYDPLEAYEMYKKLSVVIV